MKTFFIADTHFNHNKIIDYCNRPFSNTEEMDKQLIDNWNNTVSKNDIVYHLGDFALGNVEVIKKYREQLNGKIFLVQGNHDGYSMRKYYEAGFDKVYDKPIIYQDFFILSHQPLFITENMPYANIFGHIHNNPEYTDYTSNTFCVSCERINYKPILIDDIVDKMQNYKLDKGE